MGSQGQKAAQAGKTLEPADLHLALFKSRSSVKIASGNTRPKRQVSLVIANK